MYKYITLGEPNPHNDIVSINILAEEFCKDINKKPMNNILKRYMFTPTCSIRLSKYIIEVTLENTVDTQNI